MSMLFKRIKDWATTITAFRTGDVIAVDGPSGTAKMTKENLLNNSFTFAKDKDFFATKLSLLNETSRAVARENEIESLFVMPTEEAVAAWLDAHPEATTTVQDRSLTNKKLVLGTLGFVTPEMYGATGDGVTDDFDSVKAAILSGYPVNLAGKTYRCRSGNNVMLRISTPLIMYNGKLLIDSSETMSAFIEIQSLTAYTRLYNVVVESVKNKVCAEHIYSSDTLCSNIFFLHGNVCGAGTFENCRFINIDHALKLDSNQQYLFRNCEFVNVLQGVYLNGFQNTRMESCRITQDLAANSHYHCIYFAGTDNVESFAEIINCNMTGVSYPIHLYSDSANRPKKCYVYGCVISATNVAAICRSGPASAQTECQLDVFDSIFTCRFGFNGHSYSKYNLFNVVINATSTSLIGGNFYCIGCTIRSNEEIDQSVKIYAENCAFSGMLSTSGDMDGGSPSMTFIGCTFTASPDRAITHYISIRNTSRDVFFDKCVFDSCYKSGSSTARVFYNPSYTGTLSMINCIFYCTMIGADGYTADPSTNLSIQLPVRLNVPLTT